MAKRSSKKTSSAEKTTTYSTRLNHEQREQLEEAAALAGVSASRFIRDAALRAASDLVNASPPNDRALAVMARSVARQLSDQTADVLYECDAFEGRREKRTIRLEDTPTDLRYVTEPNEADPGWEASAISAQVLTDREMHQLMQIAENCPQSFVDALLGELRSGSAPAPEFKPKTDSRKLLSD